MHFALAVAQAAQAAPHLAAGSLDLRLPVLVYSRVLVTTDSAMSGTVDAAGGQGKSKAKNT